MIALLFSGIFSILLQGGLMNDRSTSIHTAYQGLLSEQQKLPLAFCTFDIPPNSFYPTSTSCPDASDGSILFFAAGGLNGVPPYSYDWDDLGTPQNDTYNDDGSQWIDSLPAGNYAIIVTDAMGCVASDSSFIEDPQLYVTTSIDSVGLCQLSGGIQIVTYVGPPGFLNYNWDFAFTPFDDDFGSGEYYMGFPPSENDQEDLSSGLEGGIYMLELTMIYDSLMPEVFCVWRDTFNIFIDSTRLICPDGDAYLYGGVSNPSTAYQWQLDSLNGFENISSDDHHTGTTSALLHLSELPSSWNGYQYRCMQILGADTTFSDPFKLRFVMCWDGSPSVWENPASWNCNVVPDIHCDVFVPDYGILFVFNNAFCKSLTLLTNSKLRIIPPGILTIEEDP